MLRFFWRLLVVGFPPMHKHEWETIEQKIVKKTYIHRGVSHESLRSVSHESLLYVQRCKGCGKINEVEI